MPNPFDNEGNERAEREKQERHSAGIENFVHAEADKLRSSDLIKDHQPTIEIESFSRSELVHGGKVILRNTASNETRELEYLLGDGWSVQTDAGMFPGSEDFVVSEIRAWVKRQS